MGDAQAMGGPPAAHARAARPGQSTLLDGADDTAAAASKPGQRSLILEAYGGSWQASRQRVGAIPDGPPAAPSGGSGEPLPERTRAKMESSFGASFSSVRVHEGPFAASLGADAIAHGEDIHVASGHYQPHDPAGQVLLGHELAHVVQQRGGNVAVPQGDNGLDGDPALEAEADRAGELAAAGRPALVRGVTTAAALHMKKRAPEQYQIYTGILWIFSPDEPAPQDDDISTWVQTENKLGGPDLWRIEFRSDAQPPQPQPQPAQQNAQPNFSLWKTMMIALQLDLQGMLGKLDFAKQPELRELFVRAVSSALMVKNHLASVRSLEPRGPALCTDEARNEAPRDVHTSQVYNRSQTQPLPPQADRFKDGIASLGDAGKSELLPTHNTAHMQVVNENGKPTKYNVKQKGGLTFRDSSKKHDETIGAHAGARVSNVTLVMDLVTRLLKSDESGGALLDFVSRELREWVPDAKAPEADESDEPDEPGGEAEGPGFADHVEALLEGASRVMFLLGRLSETREADGGSSSSNGGSSSSNGGSSSSNGGSSSSNGGSSSSNGTGTTRHTASPMVELESDPYLSTSYVTRKIGQTTERADTVFAGSLKLKHMEVKRQGGNAQITIGLPFFGEAADQGARKKQQSEHEYMVTAIRIHLAARITRLAVAAGMPLGSAMRQSFGFLDTTLADTGDSIRISIGTEPHEYLALVCQAIVEVDEELDRAIATARQAPQPEQAFAQLYGIDDGQRLRALRGQSPENRVMAFLRDVIGEFDLEQLLGDVRKNIYGDALMKQQGVKDKRAFTLKMMAEANEALAKRSAGTQVRAPRQDALVEYEQRIVEPLSVILQMLAEVLAHLDAGNTPLGLLDHTRDASLQTIEAALRTMFVQLTLAAVKGGDGATDRARTFLALRNASEDLYEGMLVLLASSTLHATDRPEDRVAHDMSERTGAPTQAARTDSGQQAAAHVLALLRREHAQKLIVDMKADLTYFELSSFLKDQGIKAVDGGKAHVSVVDPRPYVASVMGDLDPEILLTKVKQVLAGLPPPAIQGNAMQPSASPPPYTIVVDCTNIDYTNPVVLGAIKHAIGAVQSERLRFVLFTSGAKHEQVGQDKYQYGRIIVVGRPLAGLADLNRASLLTQFLNLVQTLRERERAPIPDGPEGDDAPLSLSLEMHDGPADARGSSNSSSNGSSSMSLQPPPRSGSDGGGHHDAPSLDELLQSGRLEQALALAGKAGPSDACRALLQIGHAAVTVDPKFLPHVFRALFNVQEPNEPLLGAIAPVLERTGNEQQGIALIEMLARDFPARLQTLRTALQTIFRGLGWKTAFARLPSTQAPPGPDGHHPKRARDETPEQASDQGAAKRQKVAAANAATASRSFEERVAEIERDAGIVQASSPFHGMLLADADRLRQDLNAAQGQDESVIAALLERLKAAIAKLGT